MPCDKQVRTLLEPLPPRSRAAGFVEVFAGLAPQRLRGPFRVLEAQLLVALDGPNSFSSTAIHGSNWRRRQLPHGQPLYEHAAVTPVSVNPGQAQVMALPPASLRPHAGHSNQAREREAGQRWLCPHAAQLAPPRGPFLGEDL